MPPDSIFAPTYSTSDPMFYLTAPVLSWNPAMDNLFSTTGVLMPPSMTNPTVPPPAKDVGWPAPIYNWPVTIGVVLLAAAVIFKR